jgi:flagellar assembly protein FliH
MAGEGQQGSTAAGGRGTRSLAVEPFCYRSRDGAEAGPAAPESGPDSGPDPGPGSGPGSGSGSGPGADAERLAARLATQEAEWTARCEAVRSEALRAGRVAAESERAALLGACADAWTQAVAGFTAARDGYFAKVEREVVELALAIAARIVQREVGLDPLLLAGAVRVALGQLGESTSVQLRVPAASQSLWAEMLRLMPNLPVHPDLVAESEMKDGECVIETQLGRVDLGVRAQLKEIERGFFDLLSHRNPAPPAQAGR